MKNRTELDNQIDLLLKHGIEVLNALVGISNALAGSSGNEQPTPIPPSAEDLPDQTPPETPPEPAPSYTKEDVRKVLAQKAAEDNGKFRAEVKSLVKKYGKGGALKNVAPEDYAALIAEAEALGNG